MTAAFEAVLGHGYDIGELERHDSAIFGLTRDLEIGYVNPAWFRFAAENGGLDIDVQWGLGASVLRAVGDVLRPFFVRGFRRCQAQQRPWRYDYDCSSPDLYRRFHMEVHPVGAGEGLLVVNTKVVEAPHDREVVVEASRSDDPRYLAVDGTILQCSHCRRVRRVDGSRRWDWVPSFVEAVPENATGGLCPPCYRQHYPAAPSSVDEP